jgi:tripartite-type tricarboxylate transporter receptor subunit TctC
MSMHSKSVAAIEARAFSPRRLRPRSRSAAWCRYGDARTFLAAIVLAIAAASSTGAKAADAYPEKRVTLVVPTAPAGGTDLLARFFAERLGKALGQPFVIENRVGANGMLGTQHVARAKPDGYTLLFSYAAAHVANPSLHKNAPYDVVKDFEPVAQIGRGGNVLLVRADFPATTAQEFVDYVKAHPGKLSYCSWGIGSGGHLVMESLNRQAGLKTTHVPYRGSAPCIQDLIGGRIQMVFGDVSSNVQLIKAGKLRALLYSGPARLPMLPEVPTMNEAGFPFDTYAWYGIFAPARTPSAIVARLNREVNTLLADPDVRARLNDLNLSDLPITTPEQFGRQVRDDLLKWGKLIHDNNVSID